jgi:hypothetical protein
MSAFEEDARPLIVLMSDEAYSAARLIWCEVGQVENVFIAWLLLAATASLSAQDLAVPKADVRDVAVVAPHDRIDRFARSVSLRTAEVVHTVSWPELKIFDELRRRCQHGPHHRVGGGGAPPQREDDRRMTTAAANDAPAARSP